MQERSPRSAELYLFLVWKRGMPKLADILADLEANFTVLLAQEICWNPAEFSKRLIAFYNNEAVLKYLDGKIERIGTGPFTVIVIEDKDPQFEQRETTHGPDIVNVNVFDRKKNYREWIGHNALHASDNQTETFESLIALFPEEYSRCSNDGVSDEEKVRALVRLLHSEYTPRK